ncbi:hypothetical protein WME94_12790 [Sorangium sp. So ce429]
MLAPARGLPVGAAPGGALGDARHRAADVRVLRALVGDARRDLARP